MLGLLPAWARPSVNFNAPPKLSKAVTAFAPGFNRQADDFLKKVGFYTDFTITINFLASDADFDKLIANSSDTRRLEHADAFYSLKTRQIYVRAITQNGRWQRLSAILLHEYIHAVVHKRFADAPLWFHEGMAVYFSEGLTPGRQLAWFGARLLKQGQNQGVPAGYPKNPGLLPAFYGKCAYGVAFMYSQGGGGLYSMFGSNSTSFYSALRSCYGLNSQGLWKLIDQKAKKDTFLAALFMVASGGWGILPLLVLVAWLRRRWRLKRWVKQQEQAELAEDLALLTEQQQDNKEQT